MSGFLRFFSLQKLTNFGLLSQICKYGNFKPEKKICEEVYDLQLYWLKESSEGYPVLVIEMGKASRDYTKRELLVFAEAIITQVEKAVHERFSDRKGCPEQMIVVTKCKGASALKVFQALLFLF